jgi:hypothetical protein
MKFSREKFSARMELSGRDVTREELHMEEFFTVVFLLGKFPALLKKLSKMK